MAEKIETRSGTSQGFEIMANREGLMLLANACLDLASLPEGDEQAKQLCNHRHFADWENNVEPGSSDFIIVYKPNL
jgi:hypothetical protein